MVARLLHRSRSGESWQIIRHPRSRMPVSSKARPASRCGACRRASNECSDMSGMSKVPVGLLCRSYPRLRRRANQPHIFARLGLATRGVSRSSRTLGLGCGGRVGLQRDLGHADEQIDATVKSCGPGIPVLMPSRRRCWRIALTTGAIKPVPGESTYNPFKPLRREGRLLG